MSVFNALPLSFVFLETHVHSILLKDKVKSCLIAAFYLVGLTGTTHALVINIIVRSSLRYDNGRFLSQKGYFLRFALTGHIVTSHNG